MANQAQNFDELLSTIEYRERTTRRTTLLWTILPAVSAFILLGYSSWRLTTASDQVATLNNTAITLSTQVETLRSETISSEQRVRQMEKEIESLRKEVEQAEQRLRDTVDLSKYSYPIDLVSVKFISSRYPREARVLRRILRLRDDGVGWRLGGQSPAEGFDSPSFAAFILNEFDYPQMTPSPGESLVQASRRLYQLLEPTDNPAVGDLAFYGAGYVMFYFEDRANRPFVIGMTPVGIAALEPDFDPAIGYRTVRHE